MIRIQPSSPVLPMNPFPDKYLVAINDANEGTDYFQPVLEAALSCMPNPVDALDVGCGTGIFGIHAKRLTGCRLSGVDGSEYAVEAARSVGYDRTLRIADLDREELPFDADAFDFCLCKDVFEHLLVPDMVLKEIARVLRPTGHALIHVPNHFTLYGRLKLLWSNSLDAYGYFPGAQRWNFPHIRFFTRESLEEMARQSGFVVRTDFCDFFPAIPFGRFLLPIPAWRRALARKWPDLFAEGFALLLQRAA